MRGGVLTIIEVTLGFESLDLISVREQIILDRGFLRRFTIVQLTIRL